MNQAGRYQRSFSGMLGAMVILVIFVLIFVAFRAMTREDVEVDAAPVDYRGPALFAADTADFQVTVPRELPAGWLANSVRFDNDGEQHWHVGFLTDRSKYVGLEQSAIEPADLVEVYVDPDATQGDDVTIDGEAWQSWSDEGGDRALVRQATEGSTLVVGQVSLETLAAFVTLLSAPQ